MSILPEEAQSPLSPALVVLAIDPGTAKCGIAVARRREDGLPEILHREIVGTEDVAARVPEMITRYSPETVLIGNATGSAAVRAAIKAVLPEAIRMQIVAEAYTSERARRRWLQENPPRSFAGRLVPPGLRTPSVPYDDYVAMLLAEDYLTKATSPAPPP